MRKIVFLSLLVFLLLLLCSCSTAPVDPMLDNDMQQCNDCHERAIKEMERCKIAGEHFSMECSYMSQNLTE